MEKIKRTQLILAFSALVILIIIFALVIFIFKNLNFLTTSNSTTNTQDAGDLVDPGIPDIPEDMPLIPSSTNNQGTDTLVDPGIPPNGELETNSSQTDLIAAPTTNLPNNNDVLPNDLVDPGIPE